MKKIALVLAAAMMTFAMTLGVTGCSNGSHADAGTYNIYSLATSEMTVDNNTIQTLGIADGVILELKSDGTGTMTCNGKTGTISWKDGQFKDATETITYTKEGDKLVFEYQGYKYTLQKKQ